MIRRELSYTFVELSRFVSFNGLPSEFRPVTNVPVVRGLKPRLLEEWAAMAIGSHSAGKNGTASAADRALLLGLLLLSCP